jgi:hypothetical protein
MCARERERGREEEMGHLVCAGIGEAHLQVRWSPTRYFSILEASQAEEKKGEER